MKQQRVEIPLGRFHRDNRRGCARRRDREPRRHAGDVVAVAGPHTKLRREPGEQRRRMVGDGHHRMAELAGTGPPHLSSPGQGHQLHAVADAEPRDVQIEHRRVARRRTRVVHAARPARQDDACGTLRAKCRQRRVEGDDFGVNRELAQTPGNELRVLRAEIQDENGLMCHGLGGVTKGRAIIAALRLSHPISSVILLMTTLLIGDVSGQQPNAQLKAGKPGAPPPAPLLPAEQAWLHQLSSLPAADGAIDRDRVYIPLQEGGTIALDRETGETVWTNPVGGVRPLVLAPSAVIAVNTGEVVAFDRSTGATKWRVALPSNSLAPAVTAGELLLVALENGAVVALKTGHDGVIAWSCRLGELMAPVSLTADASAVYVTTGDSRVVAISLSSGQQLWEIALVGMLSPAAVAKDRVFVGSTRNAFFALAAATGQTV